MTKGKRMRWLGRRRERTIAAIVDSIAPAFPVLDATTRAAVLADANRFVISQVQAIPQFLRFPYNVALIGFEYLPVLRWGRPFGALDAERQAAYVALWSDARLGVLRNFVKLIRSCALLAYYDHPALVHALEAQAGRTAAPIRSAAGDSS